MKLNFWPFNRNKNEDSTLPEEVQDYYQAEKRERAGVAGLLAVGTLLATVVLALGLFFGGRWLYRTVFDNNDTPETAEQRGEEQQEVDSDASNESGSASTGSNSQGTQGANTPPQQGTSSTSTTAPTPTRTPNTGPLPRTGPDADL